MNAYSPNVLLTVGGIVRLTIILAAVAHPYPTTFRSR